MKYHAVRTSRVGAFCLCISKQLGGGVPKYRLGSPLEFWKRTFGLSGNDSQIGMRSHLTKMEGPDVSIGAEKGLGCSYGPDRVPVGGVVRSGNRSHPPRRADLRFEYLTERGCLR